MGMDIRRHKYLNIIDLYKVVGSSKEEFKILGVFGNRRVLIYSYEKESFLLLPSYLFTYNIIGLGGDNQVEIENSMVIIEYQCNEKTKYYNINREINNLDYINENIMLCKHNDFCKIIYEIISRSAKNYTISRSDIDIVFSFAYGNKIAFSKEAPSKIAEKTFEEHKNEIVCIINERIVEPLNRNIPIAGDTIIQIFRDIIFKGINLEYINKYFKIKEHEYIVLTSQTLRYLDFGLDTYKEFDHLSKYKELESFELFKDFFASDRWLEILEKIKDKPNTEYSLYDIIQYLVNSEKEPKVKKSKISVVPFPFLASNRMDFVAYNKVDDYGNQSKKKNTFDFIKLQFICITSTTIKEIEKYKDMLVEYIIYRLENDRRYKKFGISTNFLRITEITLSKAYELNVTLELKNI